MVVKRASFWGGFAKHRRKALTGQRGSAATRIRGFPQPWHHRGVPELGGHDLLREWQAAVRSLAGRSSEIPHQLLTPLQRQIELVEEILERERRMQRALLTRAFAPLDAVFDLLEQSAGALHKQSEALRESARALEQAAAMMEVQAELFERTIRVLREPGEIVKRTAGLDT
jgi:hypothetical protein